MPKYKITDPQSGKIITISGEKPPTQQDAESIFQAAGVRSQQPQQDSPVVSGLKTGGSALMRFLNIPSSIIGGATEATGQVARGEYQAPKTGVKLPATKAYPQGLDVSNFVHPAVVGGVRGLLGNKSVMEELPKAIGIDPNSGAGMAVGFAGELATPDFGDVLLGTKLVRKSIDKLSQLLPGGLKLTGKGVNRLGEELAQQGVRPTKTQSRNFYQAAKKSIGKYIADENLAGDVAENVASRIDEVQGAYDDIAIKSGLRVDLKSWVKAFDNAIARLDVDINETDIKALKKFRDKLGSRIGAKGISLKDLVLKRRALDKKIPKAQWQKLIGGEGVSADVAKRMFLQDVINSVGGPELQKLGKQLEALYKLGDIVLLQEGITTAGRIGGLGDLMAAGTGILSGNPIAALPLIAARRISSNPRVIGEGAKMSMGLGDLLGKAGSSQSLQKLLNTATTGGARISKEALQQIRPQTQQQLQIQALQKVIDQENKQKQNRRSLP